MYRYPSHFPPPRRHQEPTAQTSSVDDPTEKKIKDGSKEVNNPTKYTACASTVLEVFKLFLAVEEAPLNVAVATPDDAL